MSDDMNQCFNVYFRLQVFMLDYIRKSGMNQTAEIFAREAGITDADCGLDVADGFLRDWWGVFWDHFTSKTHAAGSNAAEVIPESSDQAQAHSQTQSQAVGQVQGHADALSRAQAEIQAWTLANNGMLGFDPFASTLGQIWGQQYYANNVNMLSEPILASTLNDDQLGVLPGYVTADFHPGWAFPSTTPRLNMDEIPQRSRRRVNRPGNRTGKTNGSNPA
ncbi:hypothetical protein M8C21_022685 [Ambrosia artemisiifolia]|uniref:LisH domain-containing protein n=1 Tax=Ambrosia artemisiifolia TaxID=4212 RepID=A0AAD5C7N1_AMBAR|nr:hypothetical protein M8C21_022685 [Ambrosia artemisiifolia]